MERSLLTFAIPVVATLTYHLSSKWTPASLNVYVALIVSYLGAIAICLIALIVSGGLSEVPGTISKLNWSSAGLAAGIFGIEFGYLLLYRSGVNVSTGMITVEAIVAMLLVPVGLLLFRESLTSGNVLGVVLTCAGLFLMTQKQW